MAWFTFVLGLVLGVLVGVFVGACCRLSGDYDEANDHGEGK